MYSHSSTFSSISYRTFRQSNIEATPSLLPLRTLCTGFDKKKGKDGKRGGNDKQFFQSHKYEMGTIWGEETHEKKIHDHDSRDPANVFFLNLSISQSIDQICSIVNRNNTFWTRKRKIPLKKDVEIEMSNCVSPGMARFATGCTPATDNDHTVKNCTQLL